MENKEYFEAGNGFASPRCKRHDESNNGEEYGLRSSGGFGGKRNKERSELSSILPTKFTSESTRYAFVPASLKAKKQWVCWKLEPRENGKSTKVPYQPNGMHASVSDPRTRSTFEECQAQVHNFGGLGFVFTKEARIIGIDLDHCYKTDGSLEDWAEAIVAACSNSYIERSPSGDGLHILCFGIPIETGARKWSKPGTAIEQGIEVYDGGRYFTVTGKAIVRNEISDCQTALDQIFEHHWASEPTQFEHRATDRTTVVAALEYVKPDDYSVWIKVGMALKNDGFEIDVWDQWSKKSDKYESGQCAAKWQTFKGSGLRLGTVFYLAKQSGFQFPRKSYELTDTGNSERFRDEYAGTVCYVPESKRFMIFDGLRWSADSAGAVTTMVKPCLQPILDEVAQEADSGKRTALTRFYSKSCNVERIKAALTLAQPLLSVRQTDFDQNHFLLNCRNGTVDLKTGVLRPHSSADRITKLVPVNYDKNATCPLFKEFLDKIFDSDQELIDFLQRLIGYSLTGSTREQILIICHGEGSNGKTTLLNVLKKLLPDYMQAAPPELLLTNLRAGGASPEVARLQGVRCAVLTETNDKDVLNESRVKRLTGGDPLTARHLHCDYFEFDPTHKVWLLTNHKPEIRGQDNAIWRRIRLIPFNVTIPEKEQDKNLADKLEKELAGILTWAVQGCIEWQESGLKEPPQVLSATKSYQEEMDVVQEFLDECCDIEPALSAPVRQLYQCFVEWCENYRVQACSKKKFSMSLQKKGFIDTHTRYGARYQGLKLRSQNSFQS